MNFIKQLFAIESKPKRGLMALEWVVLAYTLLTLCVALFTYTELQNPDAMIWGRVRVVAMTAALWVVYRLVPCRLTRLVRVVAQMSLLAWWYPDTYELNRMFSNLDHVFCGWEQNIFGCQPALTFVKTMPWAVVSELMSMGYASYYPMIALTVLFYFCCRYNEFERAALVVMASFFVYYLVFIFVPVAGPTFYYKAVGLDNIVQGVFPAVGDYFNTHTECLPTPGYEQGLFLWTCRGCQSSGRTSYSCLPVIARWHSNSMYAIGGTYPPTQIGITNVAILHFPMLLNGIYPGTLRHRCIGRIGIWMPALHRIDVAQ